jgi:endonuclease III
MPRKPPPARKRLKPAEQARIAEIFERFERLESDPSTELEYQDPFTLVVAVALSAQATDVSVNKATEKLFKVAGTPQKMLALGEEGLKPFISSIGLYNSKAKNVIALSRILVEQYAGEVPLNREALQALPGVGRKTASVVLNELRVEPAIAVDKTPEQVEADLMAIVPEPLKTRAHHWLILHGRYTCTARRPKCEECPVADLCPSRHLFVRA